MDSPIAAGARPLPGGRIAGTRGGRCRSAVRRPAGPSTDGETVVYRIDQVDCGYQNIEDEFAGLGAQIRHVPG